MNYSLKIGKIYKITDDNFDENLSYLPKSRQEHILKFADKTRQKQSLVATLLLEECLKEIGALEEYDKVEEDEFGNWIIKNSDVHFSISHSGETVLVVAARFPIGCDIEKIKVAPMNVVDKYFNQNEIDVIKSSSHPDLTFYTYWTIKESYLKLIGKGLLEPLKNVEVEDGLTSIKNHPELKIESCFFNDLVLTVIYKKL